MWFNVCFTYACTYISRIMVDDLVLQMAKEVMITTRLGNKTSILCIHIFAAIGHVLLLVKQTPFVFSCFWSTSCLPLCCLGNQHSPRVHPVHPIVKAWVLNTRVCLLAILFCSFNSQCIIQSHTLCRVAVLYMCATPRQRISLFSLVAMASLAVYQVKRYSRRLKSLSIYNANELFRIHLLYCLAWSTPQHMFNPLTQNRVPHSFCTPPCRHC